jgi:NADPH:quinone reductase-like Zn-dependent oxidoreductase
VVLDTQGGQTLEKSLRVVKPGGTVIGITGPPDPDFAQEIGASWVVKLATRLLSYRIRRQAKRRQVRYTFLFMRASGDQLRQLTALVDAGKIRPVVDKVFSFESTNEALTYTERGRPRGKVVVTMR